MILVVEQSLLNQLSVQHKLCGCFKTIPVNIQFIQKAKYIIIQNTPPDSPPPPPQAPTGAVIIA